jgi:hypothetical protein
MIADLSFRPHTFNPYDVKRNARIFISGYPSLSATATVIVNVADANDNAPVFDHATYDARVLENRPPGTIVLQPWATDLDIGRNAEIRYLYFMLNGELHVTVL